MERQNTLRTSARSQRQMISNRSNLSTLNSSSVLTGQNKSDIFNQIIGSSTDNLNLSRAGLNASSRSMNNFAASQRNQYFQNKKHASNTLNTRNQKYLTKSKENLTSVSSFVATGLDNNNETANYYGKSNDSSVDENENMTSSNQQDNLTSKTDLSNQYHVYDANNTNSNSMNKSSVKFYSDNPMTDEDEDTTTTDEITDDTAITKQNLHRFTIKKHSPIDLSIKTSDTYAENYSASHQNQTLQLPHHHHQPAPQPRSIKTISPPAKQSTPNLANPNHRAPANFNSISYDKIMNTTNTDDDEQDANSRRLLTSKVNTSNMLTSIAKKFEPPKANVTTFKSPEPTSLVQDSLNNDSILSKSTTNITNISSLTNQSIQTPVNVPTTSDYENLSNLVLDDITPNKFFSTPVTATRRNIYMTNSNNLLQVASPPSTANRAAPVPPPTRPPAIPASIQNGFKLNPKNDTLNADDDAESVMSCQLITSASLLLNRESVREAQQIKQEDKKPLRQQQQQQQQLPPPPFNPRHFVNSQATQTALPNLQRTPHAPIMKQTETDPLKPPPMETTI